MTAGSLPQSTLIWVCSAADTSWRTALTACQQNCMQAGFSACMEKSNPLVGTNQMLVCQNACEMRGSGVPSDQCVQYCDRAGDAGCSAVIAGLSFTMCGSCSQTPVVNLKAGCVFGCVSYPSNQSSPRTAAPTRTPSQPRAPPLYDAQPVWKLALSIRAGAVVDDVGAAVFNSDFHNSASHIIRRDCSGCAATHKQVPLKLKPARLGWGIRVYHASTAVAIVSSSCGCHLQLLVQKLLVLSVRTVVFGALAL